jgi:hypothetical protein
VFASDHHYRCIFVVDTGCAVPALNYAVQRNRACCARLVDVGGMKYVFPLLTGGSFVAVLIRCVMIVVHGALCGLHHGVFLYANVILWCSSQVGWLPVLAVFNALCGVIAIE